MEKKFIIPKASGLLHGGDYNPEQWPRAIWKKDQELMDEAHWNIATVGVFSWVTLEPEEGRFEFDWLDDVMDELHRNGRLATLATPSAAQPAWMSQKYPEVLRVAANGVRQKHGNRVNYCWSSPIYREKVRAMSARLAERYGNHPALAFWHVSNEYGGECFCDLCRDQFQVWLKARYNNDLDALNHAYWATFWSHTYTDWSQIPIPGQDSETSIVGLTIDYRRFVSDNIIDFFKNESAPLKELTPDIPITTNMMGTYGGIDYWKMAPHVDFVSWDSYPGFANRPMDTTDWVYMSFVHDMYRSFKQKPFLLIESTPASSNWYPVMSLKRPGMHKLEGLQAIAHGSESVMYFQWRASRGSLEKFHGSVVQHDGTSDTRVFKEVEEVGKALESLNSIVGMGSEPQAAVIYDWENAWAIDACCGPLQSGKDYHKTVVEHYRPFWEAGIPMDVIDSDCDFSKYRLIVAPMLYMLKPGVAEKIERFVDSGGVIVMTYWSGIANESDLCFLDGFPGNGLRKVFGVWNEEIDAIHTSIPVQIRAKRGNTFGLTGEYKATQLCAMLRTEGAEVIAEYASEFYAQTPALTRNLYGEGEAYYIASRNDPEFTEAFLKLLASQCGIKPSTNIETPHGVTVQTRRDDENEFVFVMNCTSTPQTVVLPEGARLATLNGTPVAGTMALDSYGVEVLTRSHQSAHRNVVMNDEASLP